MIKEIEAKTAIHHHDSTYASNWDLNIYRGCQHMCKYCYAQYSHKYLNNEGEFFNDVYAKTNIAKILDKELSKKSWNRTNVLYLSGVCDCYQPAEEKYCLMRQVLEVLIKHKQYTSILTKSPLILRDYDLISELSNVASVNIGTTVTTLNENIRQKIEPNTYPSIERLEAIKKFNEIDNCNTFIMLMPIIPYLTDNTKDLEEIYRTCRNFGFETIITASLNMRGEVKKNFYSFLSKEFPNSYEKIQKLYRNAYVSKDYNSKLRKFLYSMEKKYYINHHFKINNSNEENNFHQLDLFKN